MTPFARRSNAYVQRMAEDMRIRNFADSTIDSYTYHVDKFTQHCDKPAEELGPAEIRQYQLYLVNENVTKKWSMPLREWAKILNQLTIRYDTRMPIP